MERERPSSGKQAKERSEVHWGMKHVIRQEEGKRSKEMERVGQNRAEKGLTQARRRDTREKKNQISLQGVGVATWQQATEQADSGGKVGPVGSGKR